MEKHFSDFSALKGMKRELEAKEQEGKKPVHEPKEPARRAHTVQHLSRHEEHARSIGITKGARVRMMDTNDTGTVAGVGKDHYLIELDGLTIRATLSEFILVDAEQDRQLYASMPSSPKKHEEKKTPAAPSGELIVDLHLERIPGNESIPEWAALDYQMEWFRKVIRENKKHRGRKIIFIHGDGDGTLKAAIRKELDEVFAISCTYTYGNAEHYGTGATVVTIK